VTGRIIAADRWRVIIRVTEAATGLQIWGDCCDGHRSDPLVLQDRVIACVMRSVPPRIRGCEIDRVRRMPPQDLDAYGLAMRAFPLVLASEADATQRALGLLQRAMEIDPDYGLAAALASWCHAQLVMHNSTNTPSEERGRALGLAQRAAILDADDPLALTARGAVHTMAGNFGAAEAMLARALARDPNCGWAWARSGWLNSYRGRSELAIGQFRRAIMLDPSAANANNFVGIGSAHFGAGRYGAAARWLRKALVDQPGMLWPNRTLSVSYARLGERNKAVDALEALRRYSPDLTVGRVVAALPFRRDYLACLADGLGSLGLPP
jgi:tetratricopeptide (TPR) repeat protein